MMCAMVVMMMCAMVVMTMWAMVEDNDGLRLQVSGQNGALCVLCTLRFSGMSKDRLYKIAP